MTKLAKFTIVEMCSQTDIITNLLHIEYAIKTACANGASLVVLPENAFCFGQQQLASDYFEPLKDWCSQAARHYGVYLLAGTLPCPYRPDGTLVADGKLRQTCLLFDPAGDCIARYDKIHLFKATVNDSTGNYDESKTFEAGNQLVTAATPFGNIGLMVCFDIRFASLATRLRQLGADILTAPSAFTYQTGKAHWQSLLVARALDSQCLVIGAGQTGDHQITHTHHISTRSTWGHSQFVNANGEVVTAHHLRLADLTVDNQLPTDNLPLSHHAKTWLPTILPSITTATSAVNTIPSPTLPTLITTDFDSTAQHTWRQNIALMDCQKFTIIDPSY